MSEYVRQHWIPDTYLDAWCDPDPARQNPRRVHRYSVDGKYRDYRPPSRIFTIDDLYTVPEPDGGRDLETEHALSRLEDSFAQMRASYLLRSVPLPQPARRDLVWFIAALRNRSPAMHAHHTAFNGRILDVATSTEGGLKAMSPEKRAEWIEKPRRLSLHRANETGISLSAFREMAAQPFGAYLPEHVVTEAQMLERMQLVILRVPDGQSLITSDRPVVWWDPKDPTPSRSRLGLGRRTIEITVPLTPFLCAQLSRRPGPDYADTNVEGVDILNLRTLNRACEVFIAHRPDLVVDWQDGQGGGSPAA